MLDADILRDCGWPEGEPLALAHVAARALAACGLQRDAVLVWLEQVRYEPARHLDDPVLSALAASFLHTDGPPTEPDDDDSRIVATRHRHQTAPAR